MDEVNPTVDKNSLSSATVSFGISLAAASVVSALLVVAKERSPALMASMKSATGHHWATHSLVALGTFLLLGFGLSRANSGQGLRMSASGLVKAIVGGIVGGSIIIGGYYLFLD